MKVGDRVIWSKVHGPIIRQHLGRSKRVSTTPQPALVIVGIVVEVRHDPDQIKVDTGDGLMWLDPTFATVQPGEPNERPNI